MTAKDVATLLEHTGLMAILRGSAAADTGRRLQAAGVAMLEVSLVTDCALRAVATLAGAAGIDTVVGAGTVLTVEDARRAVDHGAEFLVSPNLDLAVVEWAGERDILHLPGVFTPTEVASARAAGAAVVKLFPAARLGPAYLADLFGPFPDLRVMATGGIELHNAASYLDAGAVAVGVGGGLVPADLRDRDALLHAHVARFVHLTAQHARG